MTKKIPVVFVGCNLIAMDPTISTDPDWCLTPLIILSSSFTPSPCFFYASCTQPALLSFGPGVSWFSLTPTILSSNIQKGKQVPLHPCPIICYALNSVFNFFFWGFILLVCLNKVFLAFSSLQQLKLFVRISEWGFSKEFGSLFHTNYYLRLCREYSALILSWFTHILLSFISISFGSISFSLSDPLDQSSFAQTGHWPRGEVYSL